VEEITEEDSVYASKRYTEEMFKRLIFINNKKGEKERKKAEEQEKRKR